MNAGIVALYAASITGPSAQPSLVSLVQSNLSAVVVVATVIPITVITVVTIITASAIMVLVAIPSPLAPGDHCAAIDRYCDPGLEQ